MHSLGYDLEDCLVTLKDGKIDSDASLDEIAAKLKLHGINIK